MTTRAGPDTGLHDDPRADLRWGTIPRLLDDVAARRPDAEAVADGDRRLTFAELAASAGQVARGLMAAGVGAGDRVAIWAPNSAAWVAAALGAVSAGGILVTLNTRFRGAEAAYVLRSSGARLLFCAGSFLGVDYPAMLEGQDLGVLEQVVVLDDRGDPGGRAPTAGHSRSPVAVRPLGELLAEAESVDPVAAGERAQALGPDDPSDLLFTSGTTGRPKGAVSTHGQSLRTFGAWASIVGLREDDRYLVVNPFFHTFGYKAGILACLMTGATVLPEAVFDVPAVLDRVAADRVTVLPGPPTLYQSILADPRRSASDLSSLRLGVTGAAVVPVELVVAMKEELGFETVLTGYGLTESCGTVTMCRRGDSPERVATTSGRAIPGLEVKVVGTDGEAPRGEPGEILVRGYTVMKGYWDDPAATAEVIDEDGWLHTGDIGTMDAEGYVRITDRMKDMFVVGGFNAYPAEIEALLTECPGVVQVAVVGVPDERLGEVGCAYVVASEASDLRRDPHSLLEWARGRMANYKVPRHVEVVEALPLNASGKVLKTELRRRFVDRPASNEGSTVGSNDAGSNDAGSNDAEPNEGSVQGEGAR